MSTGSTRDSWERLVAAVIKKEQIWQLCHQDSITTVDSDFSERDLSLRSVPSSPSHQLLTQKSLIDEVRKDGSGSTKRFSAFFWRKKSKILPKDYDMGKGLVGIHGFNSAGDLDTFLSESSTTMSPNNQLYLGLYHSPILLNDGTLSFCLEEGSGKKCYMVGARGLSITWAHNTPQYWYWTSHPDSRFSEVAHLKSVCWLEIKGCINTRLLSWETIYGAYLVFKLDKACYGLGSADTFVNLGGSWDLSGMARLDLQPGDGTGEAPVRRADGWMEVQMGSFYNDRGDDRDVWVKLLGVDGLFWKSGLIVQGIEFRPIP